MFWNKTPYTIFLNVTDEDEYFEMKKWLNSNIGKEDKDWRWHFIGDLPDGPGWWEIYFRNEEDAMACKLRWL